MSVLNRVYDMSHPALWRQQKACTCQIVSNHGLLTPSRYKLARSMLIHINSYPGVGKLTIGRLLADELGAKFLDNHTIYNVAFALTEFKSEAFYDAVKEVRSVAYQIVKTLPVEIAVILTIAHAQDSDWGNACWDEAVALARVTGRPHVVVILECSRKENARRITSPDRDEKRNPRDPTMFRQGEDDRLLIDRDGDRLLRLDITELSATEAAETILAWLRQDEAPTIPTIS